MNERIKQITGQVLDEIVPDTWTTLGYDKIKEIQYRTAELIVKECMNAVCDPRTTYLESMTESSAMYTARERIRKHFGG